MTETVKTKRQIIIFLLVAYGVTYLMGILTWYGSTIPVEMSVFPNAQMFYPAAGVMLAYLLTRWEDSTLPKWFYLCFLLVTLLLIVFSILFVVMPEQTTVLYGQTISLWSLFSQYATIVGSILCWITLLISGKKRRAAYGLGWKNWKSSLFCILVFLVIYFGRAALAYAMEGQMGVIWGLWHIFLDFFYYTTPDRGIMMTISQIITCVTLGIFFAWAYMKTNNIWVPVCEGVSGKAVDCKADHC